MKELKRSRSDELCCIWSELPVLGAWLIFNRPDRHLRFWIGKALVQERRMELSGEVNISAEWQVCRSCQVLTGQIDIIALS